MDQRLNDFDLRQIKDWTYLRSSRVESVERKVLTDALLSAVNKVQF